MTKRKGILLAGGSGTRLWPVTMAVSKQLLPVYDKPMIYYPLSVLMLAGIRDIAVITTPEDKDQFQKLLGEGERWGVRLTYLVQPTPNGLAEAYRIAETFLDGSPSAMILGDNIFFGQGLPELMAEADKKQTGGTVFGYHVADPERYGVVAFDAQNQVTEIVEKPKIPPSNYVATGLYFLDETASERSWKVEPSARNELEIVSLLNMYLDEKQLYLQRLGRGYAWLDTGTHSSLLDAGNFVKTLQERQGLQVGCLEEIAYDKGWIDTGMLEESAERFSKNEYGQHLSRLLKG